MKRKLIRRRRFRAKSGHTDHVVNRMEENFRINWNVFMMSTILALEVIMVVFWPLEIVCRPVRIIYQALKALRVVEKLLVFFTFSQTRGHNSSTLHFAETWRPTDFLDFLELVRVRAIRTSFTVRGWALFCKGVPRVLFFFEPGANYNHDVCAA